MAKKVNQNDLNFAVLSNKKIKKQALEVAKIKLEKARNQLIQEFQAHSVSKEIKAGPNSTNLSGTLGGYGNLFSFIGFNSGSSPVDLWIAFIKAKIQIKNKNPKTSNSGDKILFEFDASGISDADLVTNAQMPWELGRSWIKSIEQGISGFSFYVAKKLGRSGGGIQSENKIRTGQFQRKSYWSSMWKKFLIDLK